MTEPESLIYRIGEELAQESSGVICWSPSSAREEHDMDLLFSCKLISFHKKELLDGNIYEQVRLSNAGRSSWRSIKSRE